MSLDPWATRGMTLPPLVQPEVPRRRAPSHASPSLGGGDHSFPRTEHPTPRRYDGAARAAHHRYRRAAASPRSRPTPATADLAHSWLTSSCATGAGSRAEEGHPHARTPGSPASRCTPSIRTGSGASSWPWPPRSPRGCRPSPCRGTMPAGVGTQTATPTPVRGPRDPDTHRPWNRRHSRRPRTRCHTHTRKAATARPPPHPSPAGHAGSGPSTRARADELTDVARGA